MALILMAKGPAAWAGATTVTLWPVVVTVIVDPAVVPNLIDVAPVKFVPVKVTVLPPVIEPLRGVTLVIFGVVMNRKPAAFVTVPPIPATVVTETVTEPATCVLVTTVMCVACGIKEATAPPKLTAVAPVFFDDSATTE